MAESAEEARLTAVDRPASRPEGELEDPERGGERDVTSAIDDPGENPGPAGVIADFCRLCRVLDESWISVSREVEAGLDATTRSSLRAGVSRATAALFKVAQVIDDATRGDAGDMSED